MNIAVSTTAFAMKRSGKPVLVQNLGPGMLYVSFDSAVSSTSGIQLDVFDAIELPGASHGSIYFLSDSTADVRLLGGVSLPTGVVAPTGPFIQHFLTNDGLAINMLNQEWSYTSFAALETKLVLSESSNAPINYSITLSSTDPNLSVNLPNPTTGTISPGTTEVPLFLAGSYFGSAGQIPITAQVTLSSADSQFEGLTATTELTLTWPAAEFTGYSSPLVEGGSAVDLQWEVYTAPTSDVTVNYASSTAELSFTSGTILSGTTGAVAVGTVQLSDNGIDDDTLTLTATTSSADPNYDGLILSISGIDNPVLVREQEPVPSGVFQPAAASSISMTGVTTTTANLALAYTPTGDVNIDLAFDTADFTVSPTSLTFTTGNFATPQTVTVSYVGGQTGIFSDTLTATVAATSADTARIGDSDLITTNCIIF